MSHPSGDRALCSLPEQENVQKRRGCSKDRSMCHWGPSESPSDFWRWRSAIGSEGRRRIARLRRSIVRSLFGIGCADVRAALRTPPKSKRKGGQKTSSLLTASAQGRRNITGSSTGTSGARSRPSLDCVRRASSQTRNPPFSHTHTHRHTCTHASLPLCPPLLATLPSTGPVAENAAQICGLELWPRCRMEKARTSKASRSRLVKVGTTRVALPHRCCTVTDAAAG